MIGVLVCLGCVAGGADKQQTFVSRSSGGGEVRDQGIASEGPLPGSEPAPSHCVFTWWEATGSSPASFNYCIHPIHEGFTLMT